MKFLGPQSSGSIAGTTYARNRYGQYQRNRRNPVNQQTPKQTAVRVALRLVAQSWQAVSQTDQAAWKAFSAAHPVLDKLGQSIVLAPNAWFIKANVPNVLAGISIQDVPPSSIHPPSTPITYTPAVNHIGSAVNVDYAPDPFPADTRADVFAGAPRSPGVSFDKNLRFIGTINQLDTPSPADFTAAYVAAWGNALQDQKVFFRIDTYVQVGSTSPAKSLSQTFTVFVS